MVSPLRRPCKVAAVLAVLATASPSNAWAAACHKYSVWHYPKPQRCFTALAPRAGSIRKEARLIHEVRTEAESRTNQETPPISLPDLGNIVWGAVGPDELLALAKLRALYDAR